ncbi:hypothetical protein CYMTET_23959, partial [Cymbomonas tetramitiformis]
GNPFSAHPKIDPETGRLVTFSYQICLGGSLKSGGLQTRFTIYELDQQYRVQRRLEHEFPGYAFMHDFAITKNYYVMFHNPVDLEILPFMVGEKCPGECLVFDVDRPTRVHLIPRGPLPAGMPSEPVALEMENCFVFHHANAYEDENGCVVVDSVRLPELGELLSRSDSDLPFQHVDWSDLPVTSIWRQTISPWGALTKAVQTRQLSELFVEFPKVSPKVVGREYRYVYLAAGFNPRINSPLVSWLKLDMQTGEETIWSANNSTFVGEPEFVPRPGGIEEDDGWLMGFLYDGSQHTSEFVIVDARHMSDPPIARLRLKHHIPHGLHGMFVNEYYGPSPFI